MGQVTYLTVDKDGAGQRIDNFLIKKCKGVPKARLYRAIRTGEVRVNKKRVRATYRVCADDELRLPPLAQLQQVAVPVSAHLLNTLLQSIIYEDEHLLVLNKPSGFAVHKGSGIRLGVIDIVQAHYPHPVYLVHRLDRATSGCLLIAKDRPTLLALHEQIRRNKPGKYYLALVKGALPSLRDHLVDVALSQVAAAKRGGAKMLASAHAGVSARSYFTTQLVSDKATLLKIKISTGRTHQIRVHAAYLGHPIAGDDRYGDRAFNCAMRAMGLDRLFLHALRLTFTLGGKTYDISAPLEVSLQQLLDRLF